MAPAALARLVATKRFTSKKGDLPMVIELNTRTIISLFCDVAELAYTDLGWGDEEVVQLCEVLPFCQSLNKLLLYNNAIGDAGMRVLSDMFARGAMAQLTYRYLNLNSNSIDDHRA
eukprot:1130514-Prymnesium_polylepis.1